MANRIGKFIVYITLLPPQPIIFRDSFPRTARKYSTPEATWVSTWIQLDEQGSYSKLCCEWEGKDSESIQRVLEKIKLGIPNIIVDGPYVLVTVDHEVRR